MFGAYIIGDELLVGKREDKHLSFLIAALAKRGLRLSWAHYLGDDPARLTEALRRSFASSDVVFSFGGIGATPDDYTRQCAAAALGVPLVAICGSTDPVATGPFSPRATVLHHPLDCNPCFKRTCDLGYACLHAVTVDEVLAAARPWLGKKP